MFMNNTIFAERLKEARTALKITQAELCKKSGVTAATISAYESADGNKGKNPSLDNALKLAQALNVSLDWLCGFNVKYTKAPIIDFLKMLVTLDETTSIAFDDIDLLDSTARFFLPNAYGALSGDEIYANHLMCKESGIADEYVAYVAVFHNGYIQSFISEWQKMRALYKAHTIDKDLYNLWLNKQYSDIEKQLNGQIISTKNYDIFEAGDENAHNPKEE